MNGSTLSDFADGRGATGSISDSSAEPPETVDQETTESVSPSLLPLDRPVDEEYVFPERRVSLSIQVRCINV